MDAARAIASKLESGFQAIETGRMKDIPILNRALKVEAVGMRAWQDHWICVLVTPWFMSIVMLPTKLSKESWFKLKAGQTCRHGLPGGVFSFIVGEENGLGKFQSCSLFSPVFEFADQETAVQTATAVLDDVMSGAAVDERSIAEQAAWNRVLAPEAQPTAEETANPPDAITSKEVSRRSLLGINAVSTGETA